MLLKELLDKQQISYLLKYELGEALDVSIEMLGGWVRSHVHTTLCLYQHEWSVKNPGAFLSECKNKRLNCACGHTYSLDALMSIIQRITMKLLKRDKKDIQLECGNPATCLARSARADELWAQELHIFRSTESILETAEFVRTPPPQLLAEVRMSQLSNAESWKYVIHATLCAFEEVVSMVTIESALGRTLKADT